MGIRLFNEFHSEKGLLKSRYDKYFNSLLVHPIKLCDDIRDIYHDILDDFEFTVSGDLEVRKQGIFYWLGSSSGGGFSLVENLCTPKEDRIIDQYYDLPIISTDISRQGHDLIHMLENQKVEYIFRFEFPIKPYNFEISSFTTKVSSPFEKRIRSHFGIMGEDVERYRYSFTGHSFTGTAFMTYLIIKFRFDII